MRGDGGREGKERGKGEGKEEEKVKRRKKGEIGKAGKDLEKKGEI